MIGYAYRLGSETFQEALDHYANSDLYTDIQKAEEAIEIDRKLGIIRARAKATIFKVVLEDVKVIK